MLELLWENVAGMCMVVEYRCMTCGADLEQHVNGKIVYLPHITRPADMDVFVKEWSE